MWPFLGGMLGAVRFELKVPGQDSQATIVSYGSGTVYSGIRFQPSNGDMERRLFDGFWGTYADNDMWIHSDAKDPDIFDSSKYECRLVNVAGDAPSGDTYGTTGYGADDFWHDLDTTPNWWVAASGLFDVKEFTGLIQIREKLDHTNIRTGDIKIRAVEIGL